MNDPPDNFNITDYISFVSSSTRAATMNRIKRTIPLKPRLNSTRHFYFNRMVRLWNSLPNIDLQLPFNSIRRHILGIFWQVFIQQFDVNNSCTWYVSCPCTKCTSLPSRIISFTTAPATGNVKMKRVCFRSKRVCFSSANVGVVFSLCLETRRKSPLVPCSVYSWIIHGILKAFHS